MMQGFQPPIQGHKIGLGTVGWSDDPSIVDLATDGGTSLVKVQLYRGRNPVTTLDNTRAQGYQILCQVLGPLFWIPPKNTKVIVAFPDGFEQLAGAGVILGSVGTSPQTSFDETNTDIQPLGATILNLMGGTDYVALATATQGLFDNIVAFAAASGNAANPQVSEIKAAATALYDSMTGAAGPPPPTPPYSASTSVAATKVKAT